MEENNTQAIDLSCYRWDGSWTFYDDMIDKFGLKITEAMYRTLYDMAIKMKVGDAIDLQRLCKNPEKLPYIVRLSCVIVVTQRELQIDHADFVMNSTYTKLRRIL